MVLAGINNKRWLVRVRGGVALIDHFIKDIILPHRCQKGEECTHVMDATDTTASRVCFASLFSSFGYSFGTFIQS